MPLPRFLISLLIFSCSWSSYANAATPLPVPAARELPAFPGAEGFGAYARGGRGGRVIEVTSLEDSGPGSLRAAVEAKGPRTVVFRTGGTINLKRTLWASQPYLTIAGQTAPGDGIAIRGAELEIETHDVVVRGVRWRSGEGLDNHPLFPRRNYGCIRVSPGQNVIVDHCSLSWSTDKCATTWMSQTKNVTYQWCIFSEPLAHAHKNDAEHARAFLLGDYTQNITLHHNLFLHAQYRMPEVKGATTSEIINNVRYNWTIAATLYSDWESHGPIRSNHIANYSLSGPDTPQGDAAHSVQLWASRGKATLTAGTQIYVTGDVDSFRPESSGHDWDVVYYRGSGNKETYLTTKPAVVPSGVGEGVAVTTQTATAARDLVLLHAGALVPTRDAVDQRMLEDIRLHRGRIVGHISELGDHSYPVLARGSAPLDTDHDGMPDTWEQTHGLDPHDGTDGNRLAPDGYTWLETYLNSLIPSPNPTAPSSTTH